MSNPMPAPPLPQERHEQILSLLATEGAVRVAALAQHFSVAEETIRRDLERLGEAGVTGFRRDGDDATIVGGGRRS